MKLNERLCGRDRKEKEWDPCGAWGNETKILSRGYLRSDAITTMYIPKFLNFN